MPLFRFRSIALACALYASAACSQANNASAPSNSAGADSAAAPADSTASGDDTLHDCAKLFAPSDAAALFTAPVKVSDYGPAGGMCSFETAKGASITLVRSSDPSSEMQWKEKKSNPSFVNLAGVGDEALRVKDSASIIISKKGNVYCSAQLFGYDSARTSDDIAKQNGDERAKALGALCNKAFAAH